MKFGLMQKTLRGASLAIGIGTALASVAAAAGGTADWSWLVPFEGPIPQPKPGAVYHLPDSKQTITNEQLRDLKHAVDWFPEDHPAAPAIVLQGHDNANACGFCHLPNGNGRPENSSLAGLPADYIKRQVAAFADGSRQSAAPNTVPVQLMAATAKGATPGEVDEAAAYFSKLPYRSYVKVVETTEATFRPAIFIYALQGGTKQKLGERLIEAPEEIERFEQRDPHTKFIAYVPPGSIEAGRKLAATGGPASQPCVTCHGEGLRGGIAPPLAGRPATMLVRALAAFHEGARKNPEAAPMRTITAPMDTGMMISLAAYAATLKP